jgi:hypothetical protein
MLTETISIFLHITHALFPAKNRIFSQQVLQPTEYLGGHMCHKEGVNCTLNKLKETPPPPVTVAHFIFSYTFIFSKIS